MDYSAVTLTMVIAAETHIWKQTVGVTNVENLILFPAVILFMFVMDQKELWSLHQMVCLPLRLSNCSQIFFKSPQIENLEILRLILISEIRKFLMCASLQIANPQIFMINPQITKLHISRKKLHNSVSEQS